MAEFYELKYISLILDGYVNEISRRKSRSRMIQKYIEGHEIRDEKDEFSVVGVNKPPTT